MNDKDKRALMRLPKGALEKREAGAKRILTGMVADTLALARMRLPIRVTIVDDEECLTNLIQLVLEASYPGVTVRKFMDGNSGWQAVQQQKPDLLISDVNHLGMSIEEMLRRADFPVLVITNSGFELPPTSPALLLRKPFTAEELIDAVTELLLRCRPK